MPNFTNVEKFTLAAGIALGTPMAIALGLALVALAAGHGTYGSVPAGAAVVARALGF